MTQTAYSIVAGTQALDGGAMFGVVPWTIWSKLTPPDDRHRIKLAMRLLLFRRSSDGAWCLIDCGAGTRWDKKWADIYGLDVSQDHLEAGLAAVGVKRTDIAVLLATHLHFDHTGGMTHLDSDGKLVPTFPNAVHVIHRKHWEHALYPTERDQASFRPDDFKPLEGQVEIQWLDEAETALFDNQVAARCVHGHTPYMLVYEVQLADSDVILTYPADLIPTAHHLRIPYVMGYDLQPLQTMAEKTDLYRNIEAQKNHYLFLEHDAQTDCVRVEESDKGWRQSGPGCSLEDLLSGNV